MKQQLCSQCGTSVPTKAAFCGRCGAPVVNRSRSRRLLFLSGGVLLAVLLAAGGYFFGDQLVNWSSRDSQVVDVGAGLARAGEPTAEVPVAAEHEPDEAPTATAPPTIPPTKTAVPTSTAIPSKTPLPTPPLTLTSTPALTPSPTVTPTLSPGPETTIIGYSVNSQPIEVVRFGIGPNAIVFIGGIHAGFAPGSVLLAQSTVDYFTENPSVIPATARVYVILSMNPDSTSAPGQLLGRLNAQGVDLNRNWACEWRENPQIDGRIVPGAGGDGPLSAPETQAVANFIVEQKPVAVIFWEARAHGGLVSPGGCGVPGPESYNLAITYAEAAQYRWDDFESLTGQTIPGDASNWLDLQGIPAAVVLMPSFTEPDWERSVRGIEAVLHGYGGQE